MIITNAFRFADESPPVDPVTSTLGAHTHAMLDYNGERMFADVMKTARPWSGTVDSNHWPTGDSSSQLFHNKPGDLGGTYSFSCTGEVLDITCNGFTVTNISYSSGENKTTADLDLEDWIDYDYMTLDTGGLGATDIKIMRPITPGSATPYAEDVLFTTQMVDVFSPYTVIRYMAYLGTNSSQHTAWGDRVLPSHASQNQNGDAQNYGWEGKGGCYEYLILFANATQTDPWVHVPQGVDESFTLKVAQMFAFGSDGVNPYTSYEASPVYPPLDSNLNIYMEYSNELWNSAGAFSQTGENHDDAIADQAAAVTPLLDYDGSSNDWYWAYRRTARRTAEISDTFRSVFGDAAMNVRIRIVLSGQLANKNVIQQGLQYLEETHPHPVNYYLYGCGGSAYYAVGDPTDLTDLFHRLDDWGLTDETKRETWTANAYGLKRVAYEAGPSLDSTGTRDDVKEAAPLDARMYDSVLGKQAYFDEIGGDLFVAFQMTGDYQWGYIPDMDTLNTYKYTANTTILTNDKTPADYGHLMPMTVIGGDMHACFPDYKYDPDGLSESVSDTEWLSYTTKITSAGNYVFTVQHGGSAGTLSYYMDGDFVSTENISSSPDTSTGIVRALTVGHHTFKIKSNSATVSIEQINGSAQ